MIKGERIQDAGAVSRENEGEEMNVREVVVGSLQFAVCRWQFAGISLQ